MNGHQSFLSDYAKRFKSSSNIPYDVEENRDEEIASKKKIVGKKLPPNSADSLIMDIQNKKIKILKDPLNYNPNRKILKENRFPSNQTHNGAQSFINAYKNDRDEKVELKKKTVAKETPLLTSSSPNLSTRICHRSGQHDYAVPLQVKLIDGLTSAKFHRIGRNRNLPLTTNNQKFFRPFIKTFNEKSFELLSKSQDHFVKLIQNENLQLDVSNAMKIFKSAFYPWMMETTNNRIKTLSHDLKLMNETKAKEFLIDLNIGNVVESINQQISKIDSSKYFFYVGITTRDANIRFAEHTKKYKQLSNITLNESFTNFEDLALAELIGILHLRMLKKKSQIRDCFNKTDGYDSAKLILAAKNSTKFIVYLQWTTSLESPDHATGSLSKKINPDTRKAGSFWSLNSSRCITYNASSISRHMHISSRENVQCNTSGCNRSFQSEDAMKLHVATVHSTSSSTALFKCKACAFSGILTLVRKHVNEKHNLNNGNLFK